ARRAFHGDVQEQVLAQPDPHDPRGRVQSYVHDGHSGHSGGDVDEDHQVHSHGEHAGHSTAMFKNKFWLSLILTIPVVAFSPMFTM
ncbi:heavy metal translocating P-type ATPase, partial [Escherichia coli]